MGKKILFILDDYPTRNTNGCVFARKLIVEMVDLGVDCTVISPRIFSPENVKKKFPYCSTDYTESGRKITVYRPWYLHLSSNRMVMKYSMNNHYQSVIRTINKEKLMPDYVYGHFIYQCGITAARVGLCKGIPAYCAVGENSNRLIKGSMPYSTGVDYCSWVDYLKYLSGIISVSEYNLELLYSGGFIEKGQRTLVAPNGIDHNNFYYIDKKEARSKLGIPQDCFIVAFTGAFSERKGFNRLCEALDSLDNVYSIFMGKGERGPTCHNVLWSGCVPNNELKTYLCSADIFVLPTDGEGCCNAIIEALACGLPVVSSDLPFNDGILNEKNSIRIDVTSVSAITYAIRRLQKSPELRKRLSVGAVNSAQNMSNKKRAKSILCFMGVEND